MSKKDGHGVLEGAIIDEEAEAEKREERDERALVKRQAEGLGRPIENRRDLVAALEEELKLPGGKEKVMTAIMGAARALAPIFSVASVKDHRADFREDYEVMRGLSTEIIIEILCSAGCWLAHAKGMAKPELLEKFEGWAKDNGYE